MDLQALSMSPSIDRSINRFIIRLTRRKEYITIIYTGTQKMYLVIGHIDIVYRRVTIAQLSYLALVLWDFSTALR